MGWQDDPVVSDGWKDDPVVGERSWMDELARQAGLTARHLVEGPAKFAGLFVDPFVQAAGGRPTAARVGEQLTQWGLPQPESDAEKLTGAVSQAVVGGGPVTKAAQIASQGAKWVPQVVRQVAGAPGAEMAANAVGAGASELTRQAGGNEFMQLAAGAVAPLGVSSVGAAANTAGRAVNELRRPLTQAGAEQIAADAIGRMTLNKAESIKNLEQYAALKRLEQMSGQHVVGVPGARPESAAVAGDYGLIGARRAIARGDANPDFAAQGAANNAARLDDLAKLGATEQQIAQHAARRDRVTAPLREQAFAGATGPVNVDAVQDNIFRMMRESKTQGSDTRNALDYIYKRLEQAKAEGTTFPQDLYDGLHKDLNQMVGKGIDSPNGRIRLSAGVATQIKNNLADEIEKSAPGFRKYLSVYERLSQPINRLETIAEKLGGANMTGVTNALPAVTPEGATYMLSQAKLRNAANAINSETTLRPRQSEVLSRVLGDLNADTLASRGGAMPGSDTYQNIASANFLNRVLGRTLAEAGPLSPVRSTLNLVNKPFERRIQELQVKAFQDPELMLRLLRKARTERDSPTLAGLLDFSTPRAAGGLLGSMFAQ